MTRRRDILMYAGLAGVLIAGLIVLFFVGPRWLSTPGSVEPGPAAGTAEARKIRARLFFVGADGERLSPVEQEVPFGEGPSEQARRIVEAELSPPPAPYSSPIPAGTRLKTIFLTPKGEAYVDLSPEVRTNHPGGTTNEVLTVYALVNALTLNLPAITGVQILVDGKEVDTLAGHLDLRRPLEQDLTYANRQSSTQ
jgi:Sporulation and spore germination